MSQSLLVNSVSVPANLDALMLRLTRAVLREQPKDVFDFAADFLILNENDRPLLLDFCECGLRESGAQRPR